jgi:hypothetical protein
MEKLMQVSVKILFFVMAVEFVFGFLHWLEGSRNHQYARLER